MKIEHHYLDKCTIEEFADRNELIMEVHERPSSRVRGALPFYAHFKGVELKEGDFLISASGDGYSPEEAINLYAMKISEGLLIINATHPTNRREILVPRLISRRDKV
jgi:hypothetical protein